jgi:hypothetical protein
MPTPTAKPSAAVHDRRRLLPRRIILASLSSDLTTTVAGIDGPMTGRDEVGTDLSQTRRTCAGNVGSPRIRRKETVHAPTTDSDGAHGRHHSVPRSRARRRRLRTGGRSGRRDLDDDSGVPARPEWLAAGRRRCVRLPKARATAELEHRGTSWCPGSAGHPGPRRSTGGLRSRGASRPAGSSGSAGASWPFGAAGSDRTGGPTGSRSLFPRCARRPGVQRRDGHRRHHVRRR